MTTFINHEETNSQRFFKDFLSVFVSPWFKKGDVCES